MPLIKLTKMQRLQKLYDDNAQALVNLEVQRIYLTEETRNITSRAMVDPKQSTSAVPEIKKAIVKTEEVIHDVERHQYIITEMFMDLEEAKPKKCQHDDTSECCENCCDD